ncbi:response regulator [Kineococcus gynurae]|uniref:Transcriptional regulatory protein n=1 Tax=Kineococcus gynurae TaxID=452979 RepID=A0ABV5LSN8_9ACTN
MRAGGEGPLRVLVVDDDVAVAGVHRGFVEAVDGFAVCGTVHRGREVLPAVRATRPDLVLLDIHLPDESGIEVLRRLRAAATDVDVIAITAARDVETVREAMAGGVLHYLVKPFSLTTFAERLRSYAAHRADLGQLSRAGEDRLGQADVDRLLRSRQQPAREPVLPKGLSTRTLELVAGALREAGSDDVSAAELAERCGIARVSARRYLEHLESVGRATVHPRYGRAGRPENGYRWAP